MSVLVALQRWYLSHCDGEWEELYGVEIDTLDNPGWTVTIDLEGTGLAGLSFGIVEHNRSEEDWVYCRVEGLQFKGACGPLNLEELLEVFLAWAAPKSRSQ